MARSPFASPHASDNATNPWPTDALNPPSETDSAAQHRHAMNVEFLRRSNAAADDEIQRRIAQYSSTAPTLKDLVTRTDGTRRRRTRR